MCVICVYNGVIFFLMFLLGLSRYFVSVVDEWSVE